MCGCFAIALGAFFPRVAVVLLWIFTRPNWVVGEVGAFGSQWLLPLIGVILLPYTTLTYILLFHFLGGVVGGFAWFFVALAFVIDIAAWFGGAKSGYQYRQPA